MELFMDQVWSWAVVQATLRGPKSINHASSSKARHVCAVGTGAVLGLKEGALAWPCLRPHLHVSLSPRGCWPAPHRLDEIPSLKSLLTLGAHP